jgi:hypothetical protein
VIDSGMTLTCRRCQLTVLVLESGFATAAPKCCGASMEPATPPPCSLNTSSIGSACIQLGAIYLDTVTGFTVRCTRSGTGRPTMVGREVQLAPPRLRTYLSATA